MVITKKQILKTMFLPGIYPRLKKLLGTGFTSLPHLIALVYNVVRILPNNHPYLKQDMVGTYSIRQVIAEAANHITPSKKNIDQIIIFFTVIAALVIIFIQFILLFIAMIIPKANAAASMPKEIKDFFITPNPKEDLAYRLLDLVFGIPDFFGSSEKTNTALHQALHSLFEFYSFGMIIVGAMIIIYLTITVVAETAQSGIPFGRRFNKAWAPVRIIVFFGLLIPISHGLNGGQYITLASAKLGSSLASTGWVKFNDVLSEGGETLTGKKESNVARPKAPDLNHLPAFMAVATTCKWAYEISYNKEIWPKTWEKGSETGIQAWAVYKKEGKYLSQKMADTTFQNLADESKQSEFHIVFGVKDPQMYNLNRAGIAPVCGTVVFKVTDMEQPGAKIIQNAYYDLVKDMWEGTSKLSQKMAMYAQARTDTWMDISSNPPIAIPTDSKYREEWRTYLKKYMGEKGEAKEGKPDDGRIITKAVKAQREQGKWDMPPEMMDYGWAGAGIWYNKIAEQNGALISALRQFPVNVLYPRVMERVRNTKNKEDKNTSPSGKNAPTFSSGTPDPFGSFKGEKQIARTLNHAYTYWQEEPEKPEGNPTINAINAVLGTQGLFDICENTNIHPLAQLSVVGKSMFDSAIGAFIASVGTGLVGAIPTHFSATFSAASSFFSTVATIGLLVGFILFYVLPFMPFIYFFFAVGGWVKGIFEAMVAMPLWALAHLRIDGDGMPGDAAIGGYFLIFEIFIRPILIVFGLLASITIFAAMVNVLNEIFYLLIANLSGHDPKSNTVCFKDPSAAAATPPSGGGGGEEAQLKDAYRGPIDEFFFTILYTIIVYMIGTSSFRLIDRIPNDILRWINAEVPSFNDDAGDTAEGLMMYLTLGGSQFGETLGGGFQKLGGGLQGTVNNFTKN